MVGSEGADDLGPLAAERLVGEPDTEHARLSRQLDAVSSYSDRSASSDSPTVQFSSAASPPSPNYLYMTDDKARHGCD